MPEVIDEEFERDNEDPCDRTFSPSSILSDVPSYTFNVDPDTGLYSTSSSDIVFMTSGREVLRISDEEIMIPEDTTPSEAAQEFVRILNERYGMNIVRTREVDDDF